MLLLFDVLILVPDLRLFIGESLFPGGLDKTEELVFIFFLLSESEKIAFGQQLDSSED